MSQPNSTANYRKYPKKPNFTLIFILFIVTIAVIFVVAYFVLYGGGTKLIPKTPDKHPTSQVMPLSRPSPGHAPVDC